MSNLYNTLYMYYVGGGLLANLYNLYNTLYMYYVGGGLLANLSNLLPDNKNSEHLITGDAAKDKFHVSEGGLLYTSVALDREDKDSYMLTVLVGRRGLPRGFRAQQPIQIKVISISNSRVTENGQNNLY